MDDFDKRPSRSWQRPCNGLWHIHPGSFWSGHKIYALHHNDSYHPDLFRFDPDRWLNKDTAARTKTTWAPSSHGARNCIGLNLAMNEVLLAMATVLWHGNFRTAGDKNLAAIGEGRADFGPGRHRKGEFQTFDTFGTSTDDPYSQFKRRATN
ncbi:hypothetical protein M409DRAFT_25107 [Zasmidium cellare ATCC 36951]|uniref:Cytochrome P450 n=1 Tax=Zasmidium cellare ATCC 36951 TaxID=1080233 RepID=A0A6A6CDA6_ZASCE|nr:uncharacterized protein M409DRAFT_25107 [Zasmidium cellare ATCC 36951]KAF2164713.1 hypothetical protein M409DRAFT_25107 [Zasmidium cellare ATCC 36951]